MQIQVAVPDGKSGKCQIETMHISEQDATFHMMRCILKGHPQRAVVPGTFKRLLVDGQTMMSNTPAEIKDHKEFFRECKKRGGDILVMGLGLGVCLTEILSYDNVKTVTVIENSTDVIRLTWPTFKHNKRVRLIKHDALTWIPPKGQRWSVAWFDIWPTICSDNLEDMKLLHRRFGSKADWKGSWARAECEAQLRNPFYGVLGGMI